MKYWWTRVRISDDDDDDDDDDYGRWIPTGCTDKLAALDYRETYLGVWHVREWLLL